MLNLFTQTSFTINICVLFNVPCPVVWSHHQSPELVPEAAAFSKASGERPISYCSIKRFLLPMYISKNAWHLSVLDVQGTFSLHKELIGNSLFVHRQQTYTTTQTYKAVNLVWYQNSRIDCRILFSAFEKMSLLGKVALVTGASSGIGAATAIQLAKWVLWELEQHMQYMQYTIYAFSKVRQ